MGNEQIALLFKGNIHPIDIPIEHTIKILRSYNSIIRRASGTLYGSQTKLDIRLEHVQSGSFDLSGIISIIGGLQPIFPMLPAISLGIENIPELIKKWFDLLKHLKGSPPVQVTQSGDGTNVQVTNRDGQVTVVHGNIYQSCVIADVGSLAQALQAPIQAGAKSLNLMREGKPIAEYSPEDVKSFSPIKIVGEEVDTEIDAILLVVSPILEGEGVWRFKYGSMNLVAKIQDVKYLEKVLNGIVSFKHGDRIVVRLRTLQRQHGAKLMTTHYVTQVLEPK